MSLDRRGLRASLGPGLIWAATAIGVSHLVQSTRAGAGWGYALAGAVILANLLKYPFFEFGPRYAAATGRSLLEGYQELGRWAVWAFAVLTLATVFTVVGAIAFVTGSLATQLFGPVLGARGYAAALLAGCALLLVRGRYPLLDRLVKLIVVVLSVSTVAAVAMATRIERATVAGFEPPALLDAAGFAFLVALIGWMPSAVDLSVWHSLWTLERARQTGHRPTLREALLDFNIGYAGTTLMALLFLSLGALVFYGSGEAIAASGPAFAAQLIGLYSAALGSWSRPVIALAAFTAMFSTLLAVTDGFPRVLRHTTEMLLAPAEGERRAREWLYWGWMAAVVAGALLLISVFRGQLTGMVDVATTASFITSPVLGWLNLRVVTSARMPPGTAPPGWLRVLSWLGLAFGALFALVFLAWRLGFGGHNT